MMFGFDHAALFDRLDDELRLAREPTRSLFAKFVGEACQRVSALSEAGKTARVARLIETGAWIDAAFALTELEMPFWKVRRLACDGGEWFCGLSRQPWLPDGLDDMAEAAHESMPLAVLRALLCARCMATFASETQSTVPQVQLDAAELICCDNFS